MDLLSKNIKKLSIQSDLLGAFEICAIATAKTLATDPNLATSIYNTTTGQLLDKILNAPEDSAWWKILSYYTISNYQTDLAWENYKGLSDANRKTFESSLKTLLVDVIPALADILFTAA